jgi:post-segregation antitoxin (ccd killing protein)
MASGAQALLDQAIAAAGGVARLAASIGVHHSQIVRWRRSGRVPVSRLAGLEAATGIPRQSLRPDLFASSLDQPTAQQARALGLDPEAIATRAINDAIRAEKTRRWQAENREAIEAHNRYVEEHGLPLARYRMF